MRPFPGPDRRAQITGNTLSFRRLCADMRLVEVLSLLRRDGRDLHKAKIVSRDYQREAVAVGLNKLLSRLCINSNDVAGQGKHFSIQI